MFLESAPCLLSTKTTAYLVIAMVTNADAGVFTCFCNVFGESNIIEYAVQVIPGEFPPFSLTENFSEDIPVA